MDDKLKKRLIGAAVLMSLLIIFVPMLIEQGRIDNSIDKTNIPPRADVYFPPVNLDMPEHRPAAPDVAASTPVEPVRSPAPEPLVEAIAQPQPKPKKPIVKPRARPQPASKPQHTPRPSTARAPLAWIVQVASFTDKARADKLATRLRKAGFYTHINSAWVKGARRYRVRVGPELDLKRIKHIRRAIQKKTGLKGTIQRHR